MDDHRVGFVEREIHSALRSQGGRSVVIDGGNLEPHFVGVGHKQQGFAALAEADDHIALLVDLGPGP